MPLRRPREGWVWLAGSGTNSRWFCGRCTAGAARDPALRPARRPPRQLRSPPAHYATRGSRSGGAARGWLRGHAGGSAALQERARPDSESRRPASPGLPPPPPPLRRAARRRTERSHRRTLHRPAAAAAEVAGVPLTNSRPQLQRSTWRAPQLCTRVFSPTCSAPRSCEHSPPRAGAGARRAAVRSGAGAVQCRAVRAAAERRAGARGGGAEGCVLVGQGCAARGS